MGKSNSIVFRICSIAFLVQIAISNPLWFGFGRSFPQVGIPIFESFLPIFSTGLVFFLGFILWKPEKNTTYYGALASIFLCALADVHCLQIWTYFYALLFSLKILFPKNSSTAPPLFLFLAGFYFWTGFHKLNVWYALSEFPWFLEAFDTLKPLAEISWLSYATAFMELGAGLFLLFHKTRRYGLLFLMAMHLIICLFLSPIGKNWNPIVLPWNMALLAILAFLFFKEKTEKQEKIKALSLLEKIKNWDKNTLLCLIFLWFLPFLSIFGLFEKPLSFYLYTGLHPEAGMAWGENSTNLLPKKIREKWTYIHGGEMRLQLADWALDELKVPPYNSLWVLQKTCEKACAAYMEGSAGSGYFILEVKRWNPNLPNAETVPCQ